MHTLKLTFRAVDFLRKRARDTGKAAYYWDSELTGFGCYVTAAGKLSWLVQRRIGGKGGKTIRYVIERCPPMYLDAARAQAEMELTELGKGVDIVSRRKQERQKVREALLAGKFGETVELYLKRRSEPGRFWSELKGRFEREIIPKLGKDRLVATISKADIRRLIETKEDTHPAAARTLFESLRPFFKWCVERDLIAVSPMNDLSPPPIPEARDRVLTDAEIKAFWKSAYQMGYPFEPFYKLLLLTAQRRDEVAGLRRSEIDLAKATWTIPAERTKNGKEHLVHLSPQAVRILDGLPATSELLFTTTGSTSISGFSRVKRALDASIEKALRGTLKPWRVHDLRRTAASGMAALGFQPHIVERVLNHVSGATGGLVGVYCQTAPNC